VRAARRGPSASRRIGVAMVVNQHVTTRTRVEVRSETWV
jgi:hypothetical protein